MCLTTLAVRSFCSGSEIVAGILGEKSAGLTCMSFFLSSSLTVTRFSPYGDKYVHEIPVLSNDLRSGDLFGIKPFVPNATGIGVVVGWP